MKRITALFLCLVISINLQSETLAHSGGTDRFGCHAGSQPYHCHNRKSGSSGNSNKAGNSSGGSGFFSNTDWENQIFPIFLFVTGVTLIVISINLFQERQNSDLKVNYQSQTPSDFGLKPEFNSENKEIGLRFKLDF